MLCALLVGLGLFSLTCTDKSVPTYSSPDVGTAWELRTSGTADCLNGITWNGKIFVAVGGTSIYTSKDARTWQMRLTGAPGELRAVTWSGSRFVAVGVHSILVSNDALSWSPLTFSGILNSVAASDTLAVAVGDSGLVLTSTDLHTWTKTQFTDLRLRAVIWDPAYRYRDGEVPDFTGAFVISGDQVVGLYRWPNQEKSFIRLGWNVTWTGAASIDTVVVLTTESCVGYLHGSAPVSIACNAFTYKAITRVGDSFITVSKGRPTRYNPEGQGGFQIADSQGR